MKKGSAGAVDVEIGRRIRARRLELGLTQERVADALNVTFQQMQKYETGSNRVSAATLYNISQILEIDVEDLLPATPPKAFDRMSALSPETRKLLDMFSRLSANDQRAAISAIAASFANKLAASAGAEKPVAKKRPSKRPR